MVSTIPQKQRWTLIFVSLACMPAKVIGTASIFSVQSMTFRSEFDVLCFGRMEFTTILACACDADDCCSSD